LQTDFGKFYQKYDICHIDDVISKQFVPKCFKTIIFVWYLHAIYQKLSKGGELHNLSNCLKAAI